jgi:hypothetical protein
MCREECDEQHEKQHRRHFHPVTSCKVKHVSVLASGMTVELRSSSKGRVIYHRAQGLLRKSCMFRWPRTDLYRPTCIHRRLFGGAQEGLPLSPPSVRRRRRLRVVLLPLSLSSISLIALSPPSPPPTSERGESHPAAALSGSSSHPAAATPALASRGGIPRPSSGGPGARGGPR